MIALNEQEFRAVVSVDELEVGQPRAVGLEDQSICVLRLSDDVIAFENRCPHRGHPLSEGKCVYGVLRCALHGWEFALPEGNAVSPRAPFGLLLFETRIVDGTVEVAS